MSAMMTCPKCQGAMEAVVHDGVEVDRCRSCSGIWFDAGESDWLRYEDAAAAIDNGDPEAGMKTNAIDSYRCPRCGGGMLRRVDPKHTHIRYEECTSCRGSFFDAGELAQLLQLHPPPGKNS